LTDFSNICVCRFIALFFSSFDHGTFGEVAIVVYALYVVDFRLKPEAKKG
jgi:hypothetical protein